MKALHQTQVTTEGGHAGHVRSADGTLDPPLSLPRELDGAGGAAMNPEQLFAVGHAVCFESVVLHMARGKQVKLASTSVTAMIGIGPREDGGFALTVLLSTTLGDVGQATVEALVTVTHGVCSYSYAVRGNIDVQLNTVAR